MSVTVVRGEVDHIVGEIQRALARYVADHPRARADLYRLQPHCVRLRVIDPRFAKMSKSARHDAVWPYLKPVSAAAMNEIMMLVPIAPGEEACSGSNIEYEAAEPLNA